MRELELHAEIYRLTNEIYKLTNGIVKLKEEKIEAAKTLFIKELKKLEKETANIALACFFVGLFLGGLAGYWIHFIN